MGGRGFLVAERQHQVLEGEQGVGGGDEVPGEAVGSAMGRGDAQDTGVLGEGAEQVVGLRDVTRGAGEAEGGGVAGESPGAGVRVPDAEERVALPLKKVRVTDPGPVVPGGPQQRPASGVGAEGVGSSGAGTGRRGWWGWV